MAAQRAPLGLKMGGKRLWSRVAGPFELDQHELAVLLQACRTADLLDRLQVVIDEGEVIISSSQGLKANPAAVEFRQQALTLAKLMASLRIPIETGDEVRIPQQRSSVRRASLSATK
jgi:hypothetical protein